MKAERRFTIPERREMTVSRETGHEKINKFTIMFKFPDNNLFSKIQPSGISIRCPSLATTVALIVSQKYETTNKKKALTDDCPAKRHIPTEVNITSHRQMIKLQNLRNLLEPLLELLDLQKA